MTVYPPITLTFFNGFLLSALLLALRFGIPAILRRGALDELDYFPPVKGFERTALKVYFVVNTFLVFSPLFARIQIRTGVSGIGWAIYALGVILMTLSLIHFCTGRGPAKKGLYCVSRNPMCIAYFLIYTGTALLIGSWFHLALALIFQYAVHWLVLSEERWCLEEYGEVYAAYQKKVRRYF